MKRFSFRLESIYGLRQQLERRAQTDLAREIAAHAEGSAAVAEAQELVTAARAAATLSPEDLTTAQDLVRRDAFRARRERELAAAQSALARQEERVDERRAALVRAAHEREILARLRANQYSEHRAQSARAEENALADLRPERRQLEAA